MRNINITALSELSAADVAAMDPSTIAALEAEAAALLDQAKGYQKIIDEAKVIRYAPQAKALLLAEGKDTGTVHVNDNGFDVVASFPKRVEWQQDALSVVLDGMKPEEARHYAKVEIKIDERKYQAAPPAVQAALSAARIVKTGTPKFEIKMREAAE